MSLTQYPFIKLGYWNIRGLKDCNGDLKTEDDNVMQKILSHDLICLSEVHCGEDTIPSINGYSYFSMCRGINKKINRHFGGLVLYYKSEIRKGLKFLPTTTPDFFWVKLCREFFGQAKDLYLCMSYIPPEGSSYYKARGINTIDVIEQDIAKFSDMGNIMILGDLNARTSVLCDYIENDSDIGIECEEMYDVDCVKIKRTSQDKVPVCSRGKQLIELCKAARLRILNGRTLGDSFGSYTCHQPKGSSVVDYCISSEENLVNIPYFQVSKYMCTTSDHCLISIGLRGEVNYANRFYYEKRVFPTTYIWNKQTSITTYQAAIRNEGVLEKIKQLNSEHPSCSCEDVDKLVSDVSNVYIAAAQIGLKKKVPLNKIKKNNKKWFNQKLAEQKKHVLFLSRQFQKYPMRTEIRGAFFKALKSYNKERKRKARQFKQQMLLKLDELRSSCPQDYWKLLKSLRDSDKVDENIPLQEWSSYFHNLNTCQNRSSRKEEILKKLETLEKDKCFNELDFKISESEVRKALKKLKNNKAVGFDLISNEMLKYTQDIMMPILVKVFNSILLAKRYPKAWCEGYILPIYKGGRRDVPSNYRGITILSCFAKLFSNVVNNRIEDFLSNKKLIDIKQIGFKKDARTSDHMFILRSLVEKYTRNGKSFFTCFIDFKKAFDLVDHTFLLYKIHQMGICGNVYSVIKDMYINNKLKLNVKSNKLLSSQFSSNIGVAQGDPLSPNLFKMFINDISKYISVNDNVPTLNNTPLQYLLYADDIVLFAKSEKDLQMSVYGLEKFCRDWGLTVNTSKSKVLVFNKQAKLVKTKILIDRAVLETVQTYKYLGVTFHASGKFDIARQDLVDRSMKAMFKLMATFKSAVPSYFTCMHLFDSIVKPILLYGADVCGYKVSRFSSLYNELKKDVYEKCHLKYCRFILGVNKRAPNLAIYGDTGRFPILVSTVAQFVKFWHRLAQMDEKNELLHTAYIYNMSENTEYKKTIMKLLDLVKIPITRAKLMSCTRLVYTVTRKLEECFKIGWHQELYDDSRRGNYGNKLRCYRTYKQVFCAEPYLYKCTNMVHRKNISRLRMSSHKLQIEVGRYMQGTVRVEPKDRICKICQSNECEDEIHFLTLCVHYQSQRDQFYEKIKMECANFINLDPNSKFIYLMSSENETIIKMLGAYISQTMEKRNEFLQVV